MIDGPPTVFQKQVLARSTGNAQFAAIAPFSTESREGAVILDQVFVLQVAGCFFEGDGNPPIAATDVLHHLGLLFVAAAQFGYIAYNGKLLPPFGQIVDLKSNRHVSYIEVGRKIIKVGEFGWMKGISGGILVQTNQFRHQ